MLRENGLFYVAYSQRGDLQRPTCRIIFKEFSLMGSAYDIPPENCCIRVLDPAKKVALIHRTTVLIKEREGLVFH